MGTTQSCASCGQRRFRWSRAYSELCPSCRRKAVAPTIERLAAMAPCCREAYCRGRLAAAVDGNDRDGLRELGRILDELRRL